MERFQLASTHLQRCSTDRQRLLRHLLHRSLPEYFWKIQFIASDISEVALTQARSGIYSETEIKRGLSD